MPVSTSQPVIRGCPRGQHGGRGARRGREQCWSPSPVQRRKACSAEQGNGVQLPALTTNIGQTTLFPLKAMTKQREGCFSPCKSNAIAGSLLSHFLFKPALGNTSQWPHLLWTCFQEQLLKLVVTLQIPSCLFPNSVPFFKRNQRQKK